MSRWTPEALEMSARLARELGQTPNVRRVSENVVEVRSRNPKTPERWYRVVRGVEDSLTCECIASFYPYRGECWHLDEARKEFGMSATQSRELVPVVIQPSVSLLPSSHDLDVVERAAAMAYAGAVTLPEGIKTQQQVAAVMLYGLELGLKPMTALRHLYIVKGKVAPSAELMAGLCMAKERDISFHIEELNENKATIRMVRPSRNVNEAYTVTWAQIERAGLAQGANKQYPEDRLRYHCMKRLVRAYAPDLINNMDEGVIVPGVGEEEAKPWRPTVVDASDLYNDGDEPDEREDVEAGVLEDVPTATQEQMASIKEWSGELSREQQKTVDPVRRLRWTYAVDETGRFHSERLTEADADAYIELLRETHEGAQQQALV